MGIIKQRKWNISPCSDSAASVSLCVVRSCWRTSARPAFRSRELYSWSCQTGRDAPPPYEPRRVYAADR